MAGVGKLLKQAQKMQAQMQKAQEKLAQKEIEVSCGGGAVKLTISGQGSFKKVDLDPEFLKEDKTFVEETILEALNEAAEKAKEVNDDMMGDISGGLGIPGLM